MTNDRFTAPMMSPIRPRAGAFDWVAVLARRAGDWLAEQALDDRSRHVAGAQDHDDLLRRERDCEAFERACRTVPLYH
jgi:hypothetical protein